jgi:hypothetical protein
LGPIGRGTKKAQQTAPKLTAVFWLRNAEKLIRNAKIFPADKQRGFMIERRQLSHEFSQKKRISKKGTVKKRIIDYNSAAKTNF